MKKILGIYFLLLPLCLWAQEVEDDDMMQVKGNFKFINFNGETIDGPDIIYYEVKDKAIAYEASEKLKAVQNNSQMSNEEQTVEFERIRTEYGLTSTCTEKFKKNALSSMALLFVAVDQLAFKVIDIHKGQEEYPDIVWQMHQIKDVVSTGISTPPDVAISTVEDAEDGYERFRIRMRKPAGTAREDSRLIIQIYAVDCQTDDTLKALKSLVYEGEQYHALQHKRMGFNYDKNDKLAPYYQRNAILKADQEFVLDTTLLWKRPKGQEQRYFRGPFTYSFEDYTHPYMREEAEGTCLRVKPFKLLDFSAALNDIPLSEDFYEEAGATFKKMKQNIDLRFEKGTARLVADSLNEVKKQRFIEEMASYGYDLVDMTIEGGASPEGSLKRNEELAKQRANVAAQMLQGRIRIRPKVTYKPHTWADVVTDLRQAQKEIQAMQLEELLKGGGDDATLFNRIKSLPCYTFDIEPILDNQRNMICHYRYQTSRPMTPTECVSTYYERKKDYLGKKLHLTAGDFYNLYDQIQDTLELDTVTMIAYQEIVNEENYAMMNPIAPYVCNRMAMLQMRRGLPNIEILRPFINFQRHGKDGKGGIDVNQYVAGRGKLVRINRRQIVANQAACYYMEQKVDTALWLIDWLKKTQADVAGITQLEHLIKLKKLHFNKQRSDVDELEYQMAKNAVLDMSEENRAILYTEIEEWGQRPHAMGFVDRMADDSPKKWYLKGALAALNHDTEIPLTGEGTEELEGIPQYLAYFQHCFDLDPKHTYFRYYHQEAMVDETLRKKFKYKLKNRELYRKMFTLLQQRDAAMASARLQAVQAEVEKEAAQEAEKQTEEMKANEETKTEDVKE